MQLPDAPFDAEQLALAVRRRRTARGRALGVGGRSRCGGGAEFGIGLPEARLAAKRQVGKVADASRVRGAKVELASGGARTTGHMETALDAGASAVLAASIFHDGLTTVSQVKLELARSGRDVRLPLSSPTAR